MRLKRTVHEAAHSTASTAEVLFLHCQEGQCARSSEGLPSPQLSTRGNQVCRREDAAVLWQLVNWCHRSYRLYINAARTSCCRYLLFGFKLVDESSFISNVFTCLFRKKLRADRSQGMLAIIRCRTFCLPVCYPKI